MSLRVAIGKNSTPKLSVVGQIVQALSEYDLPTRGKFQSATSQLANISILIRKNTLTSGKKRIHACAFSHTIQSYYFNY